MHEFWNGYKAIAPPGEMLPMDSGCEGTLVSTLVDSRRVEVLRDERWQLPQDGTLVPLLPHLRLEAGLGGRSRQRVLVVEDVTSTLICADV